MRLLKIFLYLVLSGCIIWGLTITLGPKVIEFALIRTFGEQKIRFNNLTISPKLQLAASQVEFDFSNDSDQIRGTVLGLKVKISPSSSGWVIQMSSGRLQINDNSSFRSLETSFLTNSLSEVSSGRFLISIPALILNKGVEVKNVNISSDLNISSAKLSNLTFFAEKTVIQEKLTGDVHWFKDIKGGLAEFSLGQDWHSQFLNFDLFSKISKLQLDPFGLMEIQSLLLTGKSSGSLLEASLSADALSVGDSSLNFDGFKATSTLDTNTLKPKDKIIVEIDQGRIDLIQPSKISANFKDVEAAFGLHTAERFLQLSSRLSEVEIWNDHLPLITISEMPLEVKATMSPIAPAQDVRSSFEGRINGDKGSFFTGTSRTHFLNRESVDCLIEKCEELRTEFDIRYEFEREYIVGKVSCLISQCEQKSLSITLQTSNTPAVIKGIAKQKILNPVALIMFGGAVMRGEPVGYGHKTQF